MLYDYIKEQYKQAELIFLSDLLKTNINELDLNQQLKELCEKGLLQQYDEEVYFIDPLNVDEKQYIRSVAKLPKVLREHGMGVVIACDFEDEVNNML